MNLRLHSRCVTLPVWASAVLHVEQTLHGFLCFLVTVVLTAGLLLALDFAYGHTPFDN